MNLNLAAIQASWESTSGLGAVVSDHPFAAIGIAILLGLVTSIGPCTFAKAMAWAGYMGKVPDRSGLKVSGMSAAMTLGVSTSFSAFGLLAGLFGELAGVTEFVFLWAGVLILVMGIATAGVVKIRFPLPDKVRRGFQQRAAKGGLGGSYLLGMGFGFMLCPCCLPGLLAIFALTFAQGHWIYGVLMVIAFATGHNVPVILSGAFGGGLRNLKRMKPWQDHLDVAMGSLMVVAGILMVWLS